VLYLVVFADTTREHAMQRKASRLKAMMVAFLSITLAITICAGFYYFKIQQNEKYQNQLHFRELNNITVSLENGISAFKEFIYQQNKALVSKVKTDFQAVLDKKIESLNQAQEYLIAEQSKIREQKKKFGEIKEQKKEFDQIEQTTSKEAIFLRDKMEQFNVQAYQLDNEYKQAINELHYETLLFLDEQVNEVKVLASVSSDLNSINSDAVKALDKQKNIVEDCLVETFNARNLNNKYSACFDQAYADAIKNVESEINKTLSSKTKSSNSNTNVYNQNSPLRSISKINTDKHAGLAKLRTNDQTTESWGIEISDWLGGSNDLYPLVLLVDTEGKLIARKQNPELNSSLVGITFNDVSSYLKEEPAVKKEEKGLAKSKVHSTTKGVSKYADIMISGNEYRLFISPLSNQDLLEMTGMKTCDPAPCDKPFYVIGLREKEKFNSTKQSISRSIIAAAILFTLALIAFIPLLKIRLSSVSQAFSAWDRHTLAIGCVLLITVCSIGMYDYIHYSKVKSEQSKLSNSLFIQMRNAFDLELKTLIDIAYKNLNDITQEDYDIDYEILEEISVDIRNEMTEKVIQELLKQEYSQYRRYSEDELLEIAELTAESNIAALSDEKYEELIKARIKQYKLETFKDYLLDNETNLPYFVENLFVLNADDTLEKSVKMDGLAMWGTRSRYRGLNKDISLLKREYAVRGVQNQLWPVDIDQNNGYCEKGLFMERLFNLRDGAKSTQLSLSCQKQEGTNFYSSLSFGTQIQTFTNTILPANFGFVVFDNNTGKALYHSQDDGRSLVENVFVETDNSGLLKSYMSTPYFYNQPTSFEVDYNGKVHNFTLGTIKEGVPWTLVVFYDKENTRAINLMSVLVSLTICFVVFVLVYYFMIMIVPKSNRRGVFWPTPSESSYKKSLTIITILGGAIVFFGGLSYLIANHVFEHHQLRYQQLNNAHLGANIAKAKNSIEVYRNRVLDEESVAKKSFAPDEEYAASEPLDSDEESIASESLVSDEESKSNSDKEKASGLKITSVPCFLGTTEPAVNSKTGLQTCEASPAKVGLDKAVTDPISYFNLLIEAFWSFSVLDGNIDETLVITSKVNQTITNKSFKEGYIDNSLNQHPFERRSEQELLFAQKIPFGLKHFIYGILIAIAFAAFALVLYKITKEWIFERFFGFNIPPFFRLNEKTRYDVSQAMKDDFFRNHQYMTIVRPKLETLYGLKNNQPQKDETFSKFLNEAPLINDSVIDLQSLISEGESAEFTIDNLIAITRQSYPNSAKLTIAISGLENAGFDEKTRKYALTLMEYILEQHYINVILLCEVAPLYRLTQSELYPSKNESNQLTCASEMVRWSNVLKPFIKVYDWCPNLKQRLSHDADAATTLIQEAIAWPELRLVLKQFIIFNRSTQLDAREAYDALLNDIETQEVEMSSSSSATKIHIDEELLKQTGINDFWIPEQIIEFFAANSGALYRFKWEQCTKTERIILFQIASGLEPNPLNRGPLEHLVRRGYICRDKGWFLVNTSFKEFVLHAEPVHVIESWLIEANESIWQYLRIPFFAIVITLVAIMAYTATDAIETAIGVLSAVFALIPLAIRNFTAIKTGNA
jgi:hypothetical protein